MENTIELFSNFFLQSSTVVRAYGGSTYLCLDLDGEDVVGCVHEAMRAYIDLRVVYVRYRDAKIAKTFVDTLSMMYGKVDFASLSEVRMINGCVFLP
jgi:hypothetical protein